MQTQSVVALQVAWRLGAERAGRRRRGEASMTMRPPWAGRPWSRIVSRVSSRGQGRIVAIVAVAGVLVAMALALRLHRDPLAWVPDGSSVLEGGARFEVLDAATCDTIAETYRNTLERGRTCGDDTDCRVEDRTGVYSTLDGCWRFVSGRKDLAESDRLAARWLAGGCAHDYGACEKRPAGAYCRLGTCWERPPERVPESYKRVRIPDVLTMFVPGDMERREAHAIDSFVAELESRSCWLSLEVGPFGASPSPDAGDLPGELLSSIPMTAAERPTILYVVRRKGEARAVAIASVPDVVAGPYPFFSPGESHLAFELACDDEQARTAASIILSTLETLSSRLEMGDR
jgi:hypothetical protein